MVAIDYIILAIVLVSAVTGLIQGFLREVCSLVSWVLAVWLAWKIGPSLEPHLGGVLRQAPYGLWAGRGIVFITVLVVGGIIGAIVSHYVRLSIFSGLDRFLGLLLGLIRGAVIVGVMMILAQQARLDGEAWWKKSKLLPTVQPVANLLRALAGEHLPKRVAADG
jgi:membrane protein required for colicin V production